MMVSTVQRGLMRTLPLAIAAALCLFATTSAQGPRERTMYVSAVDEKGDIANHRVAVENLGHQLFLHVDDQERRVAVGHSRRVRHLLPSLRGRGLW